MPTLFACTDELVGIAWLKSVPALSGVDVATNPADMSRWSSNTFIHVEVTPLGLPPHAYFPGHGPRILVHCLAAPKKYSIAANTAQLVRQATYAVDSARVVAMPISGYETARVIAVSALNEPIRVEGPAPDSLARYDIALLLEWY